MSKYKCDVCGKDMVLKETKVVSSTTYNMWYCEKCKRTVAKAG